jgi:hypothetical protein
VEQLQEFKQRIEWVKRCPVEAAELIEKQKNEYITLSQSIEEDDAIISQLQQEIKQYQLQEKLLLERLKKVGSKSSFMKYMDMTEENLRLAQENDQLKALRV